MFKDKEAGREYQRRWEKKHRRERNEYHRKRAAADPDGAREYWRRWYWNHHEEILARRSARSADVREKERAHRKKRYAANPEKYIEKRRQWGQENPEKARRNTQLRRARKRAALVEPVLDAKVFERDGWRCQLCGRETLHVWERGNIWSPELDHIVPLSRGGLHTGSNVRLLCAKCNHKKGASLV